ncbi:pilus assembly protein CpaC [Undibacterium sp. GrIS 1.8]|uniref:type II and III secretion system protein family protein n=1 Tax=Undibacterium sp. GrIS 1.8 TaxID=3143934 RepID=UPI0033940F9D
MKSHPMSAKYSHTLLVSTLLCLVVGTVHAQSLQDLKPAPQNGSNIKATVGRPALKSHNDIPVLEYLPTQSLTITTSEIMVLPIPEKVVRVALGSGSVLSTTTVDSNLLLIAEQVGATSLLVWTKRKVYSYHVHVVPKNMLEVRAKVDALTKGITGISVEQVGSELVLSGMVHKEVLQQLASSLKGTPGLIFNLREDPGSAYTRSVLFRLHFIEVKRSLMQQIGVDWAKSANGPVFGFTGVATKQGIYNDTRQITPGENLLSATPPFVMSGSSQGGLFLGLATVITSRLNLGISNGDVRILASPELTAKSGGKARLQVGGEVPIPLSGAFGSTTVEFKPYGIILSIEPQIDANNVITAKISTELSQIDPAVTVSGIPGFLTRSTATEVSLKQGEIVALSGLVNSEMSTAIDRVPGLSMIPILGRLFRSDDFRNNKTELVVLLEPEIISAGDGLAKQLRERGEFYKKEFEDKALELQKKAEPSIQPEPDLYRN